MAGNVLVKVKILKQDAHLMLIINQLNIHLKPYKQDHSAYIFSIYFKQKYYRSKLKHLILITQSNNFLMNKTFHKMYLQYTKFKVYKKFI